MEYSNKFFYYLEKMTSCFRVNIGVGIIETTCFCILT